MNALDSLRRAGAIRHHRSAAGEVYFWATVNSH